MGKGLALAEASPQCCLGDFPHGYWQEGSRQLPSKLALTPSSQTPRRRDALGALQVLALNPQPSAHFSSYLSTKALLK